MTGSQKLKDGVKNYARSTGNPIAALKWAIGTVSAFINPEEEMKAERKMVNKTLRKKILDEQDWKCFCCGKRLDESAELHHISPVKIGGVTEDYNLVALCKDCHKAVHYK